MPDLSSSHPALSNITKRLKSLTPKARILGDYIVQNPGKVVLMTTRQLARACGISEATVVRFAMGMGYDGYGDLQQALKDLVNTGLALPDRSETNEIMEESGLNRLHRVILEELGELRSLYETINISGLNEFIKNIISSPVVYVLSSRISYTSAYYMGWSLTKIRKGIHILKGSDSTSIDTLSAAPEGSLVVLIATTRYPNELLKLSKLIKRLGHRLLVLTDSPNSPLTPFATLSLEVPMRAIPFTGNPSNMLCVIKYIVQEVAAGQGDQLKDHQQHIEQIYLENDIMFNAV
ncbi:MAG: MurR/RpiR family transcriptional regulator [Desulfamplus sp.]|nr:MurR/RpiR family transcriptional regulator [Desulfamplus sp.]